MNKDDCCKSTDLLDLYTLIETPKLKVIKPHAQFVDLFVNFSKEKINDKLQIEWVNELKRGEGYELLLELFGRCCYKSEDKIDLGSTEKFIKMIIDSGHESILEHINITVKFVGDRAMSHQLVRHRIAQYSQESQRYCNYGKQEKLYVICPEKWLEDEEERDIFLIEMSRCYNNYLNALSRGKKPEDARRYLPNATKTEVVTTFNIRQWRHVFLERALNPKAEWQIRMIMNQILENFERCYPILFGDLREKSEEKINNKIMQLKIEELMNWIEKVIPNNFDGEFDDNIKDLISRVAIKRNFDDFSGEPIWIERMLFYAMGIISGSVGYTDMTPGEIYNMICDSLFNV